MSEPPFADEGPRAYAIRFHPQAQRDLAEARAWQARQIGEDEADAWQEAMLDGIATLATNPARIALALESRPPRPKFSRPVRAFVWRRMSNGSVWRILFSVIENEADAPFVFILHIRHGARKPMTRREAGDIEAQE